MFEYKVVKVDKKTRAKAGSIKTSHGNIKTPAFSPVATRASVKTLSPEDLVDAGSQVVLGNTYHLYLRPGVTTINKFNGFGLFMGWEGPTITDSGGYQVSFLWTKGGEENIGKVVKISDAGATFSSYIDGSIHLLTPEKSMQIQKALGADMIMAFDQPLGSDYSKKEKKEAFQRTLKWEERSFKAWRAKKSKQALYGIVQGDTDTRLREQSLKFILQMGFPAVAMGGESIGADPKITSKTLDSVAEILPDGLPLHALGLGGGPEGILEAVSRGIDTFDNTGITRMARTGLLFIHPEDGGTKSNKFRTDIKRSVYKEDKKPISRVCGCMACRNFSRAYIHHLLVSGELLGLRLTSIHNVFYINALMSLIRKTILAGDFESLKKHWLKT